MATSCSEKTSMRSCVRFTGRAAPVGPVAERPRVGASPWADGNKGPAGAPTVGSSSSPACVGRVRQREFGLSLSFRGRSRGTESAGPALVARAGQRARAAPSRRRAAGGRSGRGRCPPRRRTQHPAPLDAPHTNVRRLGTRHRPRPRTERMESPFTQFRFGTPPDVFPGNAW